MLVILFLYEIGLCAQNVITTLVSIVNIIGGCGEGHLYDHLMRQAMLISDKEFCLTCDGQFLHHWFFDELVEFLHVF